MTDELIDFIGQVEDRKKDVAEIIRKKRYPTHIKVKARMLYEVDGMTASQIAETLDGVGRGTINNWIYNGKWSRGSLSVLVGEIELDTRMQLARKMGLGSVDQLAKAKELMEAVRTKNITVPGPDGKPVSITEEHPDYKIQNEGLKRAMELTGTKIERVETEHRHSGEIVHKYALPEKKPLNAWKSL